MANRKLPEREPIAVDDYTPELNLVCGRNGCRPWKELRNDNAQGFYIDGRGRDTLPLHPIPKTKPRRLHKRIDTPGSHRRSPPKRLLIIC